MMADIMANKQKKIKKIKNLSFKKSNLGISSSIYKKLIDKINQNIIQVNKEKKFA